MQTFRFMADLTTASLSPPVRRPVEQAISDLVAIHSKNVRSYAPADDGYVVLVEPTDTPETIRDALDCLPKDLPWEGGYRDGDCMVGILLRNSQFGLTVVVPADCNQTLRASLLDAMCEEPRC